MGGKSSNPVKRIVDTVSDTVHAPASAIAGAANAVGFHGISDGINSLNRKGKGFVGGLSDMATGEAAKQKQKAKDAQNAANDAADANQRRAAAAADASATASRESARMAGDGTTQTLLTGGTGLEDDNATISRRTLKGY